MRKLVDKIEAIPNRVIVIGLISVALLLIILLRFTVVVDLFRSQASDSGNLPEITCQGPSAPIAINATTELSVLNGTSAPYKWYAPTGQISGTSTDDKVSVKFATVGTHDILVIHGNSTSSTIPARTAKCTVIVQSI